MPSMKSSVIEWLFFDKLGFRTNGNIGDGVVTMGDVVDGIEATASGLSKSNPANFFKDITRNNPDMIWPASVLAAGFTGEDAIGTAPQAVFRFVPLPAGQLTAFPPPLAPSAAMLASPHTIQSLSMPISTKALGRSDENWLAQVAARLHVVETYFAQFSPNSMAEVTFLQTGVKLPQGEADSAYSVVDSSGETWLVSVEAKGRREKIHPPQIHRAAASLLQTSAAQATCGVIPMAMKVVSVSTIYIVEFEKLRVPTDPLTKVGEGVLRLVPDVAGIA